MKMVFRNVWNTHTHTYAHERTDWHLKDFGVCSDLRLYSFH